MERRLLVSRGFGTGRLVDAPKIEHRPVWFMDTTQGGDLVDQLDLAEVFSSDYAILDKLNTQVSWTDTIMDELSWNNTHRAE